MSPLRRRDFLARIAAFFGALGFAAKAEALAEPEPFRSREDAPRIAPPAGSVKRHG